MAIEVDKLTKLYGKQRALNSISFQTSNGRIIGFLGPNGAGKSTCMKILTGILPFEAGSVKVLGMDVSNQALALKKRIGYLPENNPLYRSEERRVGKGCSSTRCGLCRVGE